MCLFPRFIKNAKYLPNKKNKGCPPTPRDWRVTFVPIGCGKCEECRKQKSRAWQLRLLEELRANEYNYFITLTFDDESLDKIANAAKTTESNAVATYACRHFLERWRKKYKKSCRHWFITELGQTNTERIHMHGIIFSKFPINNDILAELWKYGRTDIGNYCNARTINYIVKYVTKIDLTHKNYEPKILCSAGLGKKYLSSSRAKLNNFRGEDTRENVSLENGLLINLPIYYRNHIYTENQREKLWLNKLDKKEIYVLGQKFDISTEEGYERYIKYLQRKQTENTEKGYGNPKWTKQEYDIKIKKINN